MSLATFEVYLKLLSLVISTDKIFERITNYIDEITVDDFDDLTYFVFAKSFGDI